jgi:hypothetical protein
MEIIGESVQPPFEVGPDVAPPLLEGMQHRHQDATGVSPGIRLRTAADLAGDDRRPPIAFSEMVLGRDPPLLGPVREAGAVGPAARMEAPHAQGWRWRLHARHERCCERRRRPDERGVRERWRAPPHRQGELGSHRPDEGRHLGGRGARVCEVLDLAPQMAIAILDGAGPCGITAVAVDDQTAGPPGLAEDLLGHASHPGLAAPEQAEVRGGEPPGIAMMPVRPPAGLVGVFDRGLALCLDQPVRHAGQQAGQAVEARHHAAGAPAPLCADAPQGEAVSIMPRRRRRAALVARAALGQDRGRPWWEGPATAGALPLGQPVEDALGRHRVTLEDRPAVSPLGFHQGGTVGAAVAYDWRHVYHPFRLAGGEGVPSHPEVPRPCAVSRGAFRWRHVGRDGLFGRRGRRAEKALGSLPCLVAARLFQALEGLGKPIACPWLLQTRGTPVKRHRPSRQETRCAPLGGGHTRMTAPRLNGAQARSARGRDSRGQEQAWSTPRSMKAGNSSSKNCRGSVDDGASPCKASQ